MAERRMISKKVIDTDLFMEIPPLSQVLYFHLLLRADDEGFVGNTKNIMQMIGCSDNDREILKDKKLVIEFPSTVCVIRHWYTHNYIQKDRYTNSQYTDEKALLRITKERVYVGVNEDCTQKVYKLDTKVSKGKDSPVKESKKIEKVELPSWLDLDAWNTWVDYRKEIGKPLTNKGMQIQLELLSEYTRTHVDIINNSIAGGWTRLFGNEGYED